MLAAVLAAKASTAPSAALLVLAAAANAAAAGWIFHRVRESGREQNDPISVRIDFDGAIRVRRARDGSDESSTATGAAFVSSQVLMLSLGGRSLAIWRDAVPEATYRRLAVAARWPRQQPAGTASAADAAAP